MEYIRLEHITKTFGEVVANDDVTLSIERGEVLSILGENGSGKTTLMNVIAGIYNQDGGKIYIDGEEVTINSPREAYAYGIGMVHQHYKLVEAFNGIENVVLGLSRRELLSIYDRIDGKKEENPEPKKKWEFRRTRLRESAAHVKAMCDKFGFVFEPYKKVREMHVAEKQTLEIIKALFRGVDTLILDEPTAVLTPQETQHLFDVIHNMRKHGKTVVIITHKLNEVLEISDRIAILRKGQFIQAIPTAEANEAMLTEAMVGKKVDLDIQRTDIPNSGPRLVVENLSVKNKEGTFALKDASFVLNGSEILGIAGVSGSGQKEVLDAISGLAKNKEGRLIFHNPKKDKPVTLYHKNLKQIRAMANQGYFYFKDGTPIDLVNKMGNKTLTDVIKKERILFYEDEIIDITEAKPIEIRNLGIKLSFVPEDRLGMGLVGDMDIVDNMMLRSYRKGWGNLLHREKPAALAEEVVEGLDVKTPNIHTQVGKLSGGNIQKILVGREISSAPKILMVAYPVRGLDINSSYLIYNLLDRQKQKGTGIIYVGEDLDVMLALTDRILVLCDGVVTGIVDSRTTTKEEVGLLMSKTM